MASDLRVSGITRHGWREYADLLVILYIGVDLDNKLRYPVHSSTLKCHRHLELQ